MPLLSLGRLLALLLHLGFLLSPCRAQGSRIFQWQFANNAISTSLPTCQTFPIIVKPFDLSTTTLGVPPYWMLAYPVGGVPSMTPIGSDPNNLSWQVTYPASTQLMLNVVDSNTTGGLGGTSGGIPPQLFTAVTGQTTNCVKTPPASPTNFSVTANVTDQLNTCQPWGIRVHGGVPPYTVTLAALNSPVVTNVTMGPTDDVLTYPDRADPNTQLLAAVSDLTGAYALGTPIVKTVGSTDANCTGLVTTSANSTTIAAQQKAASEAAAKTTHRNNTIIGVVVALLGAALLAGGIFLFLRLRRARRRRAEISEIDPAPMLFRDEPGAYDPHVPKFPGAGFGAPRGGTPVPAEFDPYQPQPQPYTYALSETGSGSGSAASVSAGASTRPSFTTFPAPAGTAAQRRYNKAAEVRMGALAAAASRSRSAGAPATPAATATSAGSTAGAGSAPSRAASLQAGVGDAEIIIQHRDGGGVVRELPPPYADRELDAP